MPKGNVDGTTKTSDFLHEMARKNIRCTIFFLDDSQKNFQLSKKVKGQVLLDSVFQHLELVERDYFGLQFSEPDSIHGLMRWLDPTKSIRKQMKFGPPYILYFHVKFYVSDPSKLHQEYTRYHYYLQLKKDFLNGKLLVPPATSILLASYAVQAELGDFKSEEHSHDYLGNTHVMPNQTADQEKKIMELHKLHKGQEPADAEYNFLDHVKKLDMYGVDLYTAKTRDPAKSEIQLSVTSGGLVVFQNNVKVNTFSWAKIVKISFKKKQFFIQLRREGMEKYDSMLGFSMLSYRSCKNLWKLCVEHHSFFRLHVSKPPSRQLIFSLGSKFHYSGRTEYQTLEENKYMVKTGKIFTRSPSRRYIRQTSSAASKEIYETCDKKTSRIATRVNGSSTTVQIRPYDSFSHKVQVSEQDWKPREAWTNNTSLRSISFTPDTQHKQIHYADDDDDLFKISRHIYNNDFNVCDDPENLVMIRMEADEHGRFGFNVKGGADQCLPILVSRVAPNTAADMCIPRLNEGDQVLLINSRDVTGLSHEQVVKLIRCSCEKSTRELLLTVRPNVYMGEDVEEPDFQYIPDAPHVSSKVPRSDMLSESMLLLSEGLESGAIIAQFEQLYRKKPGMTMNSAKFAENINKNRYRDISPYDATRVVLINSRSGDYINASHVNMEIPASGIKNRYIATQGPLPVTAVDFWEMVWEQKSSLIIMVTALMERGRVKCHKYWPTLYDSSDFGILKVTCLQEEENESFAYRELLLYHKETTEKREISHMQYISWPDHGVPLDASDFLTFLKKVREKKDNYAYPVIIHCSAGIGRTGVLILMETAMCLIEANEPIYPLDIVKTMRDQRAMLIQTASQYKFVCEAILKVFNENIVKPLPAYQ